MSVVVNWRVISHGSTMQSTQDVSNAIVRLELLSADGERLGWSSGVVVREEDYLSLYTCWHVVTGADPHRLPLPENMPRKRTKVRVHTLRRRHLGHGVEAIGGLLNFEIELYDENGAFAWEQGQLPEETEAGLMPPASWDVVRLNVDHLAKEFPRFFKGEDIGSYHLDIGDDAFIVGFPYGYSASESPTPMFIKRTPCSITSPRFFRLLDGAGAKGMSGGAIVTRTNVGWRLAGIYNGAVFPEATYFAEELEFQKDESKLPLGKYTEIHLARIQCGVF